jgi:hypothetical protein
LSFRAHSHHGPATTFEHFRSTGYDPKEALLKITTSKNKNIITTTKTTKKPF